MKTSFTRKLSLADLTYAASGYRLDHPNQLVCQLVIKGVGRIPDQHLSEAAAEVTRYCPSVRFRLKGFWIAKFWSASGPLPRVRSVIYDWDGHSEHQDFLDTPLDLIAGPVAEIVQVIGRNTYLVFRVHHAVTDGMGLMEFAQAFFQVLNQAKPRHFLSKVTLEKMPPGNLAAIPPPVSDAPVPYPLQSPAAGVDRSRIWKRITLPGNDAKILLKTMLAIAALSRRETSVPVRIHMPVSLRRHVPEERSLANLIGMLRIDVEATDTERELVKKIKKVMADKQELPIAVNSVTSKLAFLFPLMVLHLLEKLTIKKLLQQPRFRCSGTTSHVGNIRLDDVSTEKFKADTVFGIPVPPLGTPIMAVIMTNENSTEIVVSANKTLIDDAAMDELVNKLTALIESYRTRSRAIAKSLPNVASA